MEQENQTGSKGRVGEGGGGRALMIGRHHIWWVMISLKSVLSRI